MLTSEGKLELPKVPFLSLVFYILSLDVALGEKKMKNA